MGTAQPKYIETLKLKPGEDLEYIACSYSKQGVHTLNFKTNFNNVLLAEGDIEEETRPANSFDLNLKDHNKAIVGFQTGLNENLEYMGIYIAKKITIKERLQTSDEPAPVKVNNMNLKHTL